MRFALAICFLFVSVCFATEELPVYSVPLFSIQGYPVYYIRADIGTPSQALKMLFDLNSPSLSVPIGPYCDTNPMCYANTTYFPEDSSSASIVPCQSSCTSCVPITSNKTTTDACSVTLYYSKYNVFHTSSVEGIEIKDIVEVGPKIGTTFAGIYEESSSFSSLQSDGIFGFGPTNTATYGLSSWFGDLVSAGMVDNVFSFCMDSGSGVLVIGGNDVSLYSGLLQYSPIVSNVGYFLQADELEMNGAPVTVDKGALNPVIIDSTSGDTILSIAAYKQLTTQIQSAYCSRSNPPIGLCGDKNLFNGYCFPIIKDLFFSYPGFSFILENNVNLTLVPQYYLYKKEGYFCSSVIGATNYQSGIVFGTNILRRYYVTVDMNLKSVGFSPSVGCSDATYVIEYISGDGQSAPTGKELKNPLTVVVTGFKDNVPIPGVEVVWQINQGDGKFASYSSSTNEDGVAQAKLEVGLTIGTNIASVSLNQAIGSPVIFSATGVKGAWFYIYNSGALVALLALLGGVLFYQKAFKKKNFSEEVSEKIGELASLGLGSKDESEKMSLLDWARMHDYPVRTGGGHATSNTGSYNSIN